MDRKRSEWTHLQLLTGALWREEMSWEGERGEEEMKEEFHFLLNIIQQFILIKICYYIMTK